MPRAARKHSATGTYHVMLRGVNKHTIFFDNEDHQLFCDVLFKYRAECGFTLYSWCLMPNHVHLLLKEGKEPTEQIFRKIGSSFVYRYNKKHDRTGHLFEDRYRSEPVESRSYFLNCLRYIHMNPVKYGLCELPEEYLYSSYFGYLQRKDDRLIFGLMTKEEFIRFHLEKNDDVFLDI